MADNPDIDDSSSDEEDLKQYEESIKRLMEKNKLKTDRLNKGFNTIEEEIQHLLDDNKSNNSLESAAFRDNMKNLKLLPAVELKDARESVPVYVVDKHSMDNQPITAFVCKVNYSNKAKKIEMTKTMPCSTKITADEVIRKIVEKINMQHSYNLPTEPQNWFLKAVSTQEYLYGANTQLIQFENVCNELTKQIQELTAASTAAASAKESKDGTSSKTIPTINASSLAIDLLLVEAEPIITQYKRDPSQKRKAYQASISESTFTHSSLQFDQLSWDKVQYISLWDLNRIFRFKIRSAFNVESCSALDTPIGSTFVACEITYGDHKIASRQFTNVMPSSETVTFNQFLSFKDLKYHNIPKEAILNITIFAQTNKTKGAELDVNKNPPLAFVKCPLFHFNGFLRQGPVKLKMWNNKRANPIETCVENPDSNSICISLEFERFCYDVVYPTGTIPQHMETEFASYERLEREMNPYNSNTVENLLAKIINSDPLYSLNHADRWLIWDQRNNIKNNPRALSKFLQSVPWKYPVARQIAHQLLKDWAQIPNPIQALEFLDYKFPDLAVRQYAISQLHNLSDHDLNDLLLQLVQALKFEIFHDSPLSRFLLDRATRNPYIIGHYMFWHLKAELHVQIVRERHLLILEEYLNNCGANTRKGLVKQNNLMDQLLAIALLIKQTKSESRKSVLQDHLKKIKWSESVALPLDPRKEVKGIVPEKCKVLDSKKLPLWLCFENINPAGGNILVIFKAGDDLRQDLLTLQILKFFDGLWKTNGLDLHMKPYGCICTGDMQGMIEVVLNSDTIANITVEAGGAQAAFTSSPLSTWLKKHNAKKELMDIAVQNFVFSCAGYCCATHVLGIGDRHNDNIMLTRNGDLFHIDFGHFLGHFKKFAGISRETSPFIFTPMYSAVMGNASSPDFNRFAALGGQAFNILRKNGNTIITLFMLMLATGIPELESEKDIMWIRKCLVGEKSDDEAMSHFGDLIHKSLNNYRARVGDFIHIVAHSKDKKDKKKKK